MKSPSNEIVPAHDCSRERKLARIALESLESHYDLDGESYMPEEKVRDSLEETVAALEKCIERLEGSWSKQAHSFSYTDRRLRSIASIANLFIVAMEAEFDPRQTLLRCWSHLDDASQAAAYDQEREIAISLLSTSRDLLFARTSLELMRLELSCLTRDGGRVSTKLLKCRAIRECAGVVESLVDERLKTIQRLHRALAANRLELEGAA